ncbi:UDP-glucuronosyltransferase 2B19-like isoform X2 [Artemia franciscana]|uniref:Glucuronosyltransferase n=1 Tax=Artemia franciscana TaxID=6661 RepID=A0AA88LH21_ARTSF|nr:hypothetical protein QYM36_003618 [Artemia franciscana]
MQPKTKKGYVVHIYRAHFLGTTFSMHTSAKVVFKRENVIYPRSSVELIELTVDMKNGSIQSHNFNEFGEVCMDNNIFWMRKRRFWTVPLSIIDMNSLQCETLLGDPALLSMLQARNYSAVIIDLFTNSCGMIFSSLLKIPTIGFLQIGAVGLEGRYIGALNPPSVSSQVMSDLGVPNTFLERTWGSINAVADWLIHNYVQTRVAVSIAEKYLDEVPDVYELFGRLDLIISGSHPIVEFPKYMPQKMLSIGCFHCRPAQRIQNKVLREFLDTSPFPVILASFGYTMANNGIYQRKLLRELMKAVKDLPVRAVIAFDPDREEKELVPENVLLVRWVPQQDVLGHPKTALFISHCGISSTLEAVYHAAKVIAIPISLDQGENALRLKDLGVLNHILDPRVAKAEDVAKFIEDDLEDDRLMENAIKFSQLMRDSLVGIEDITMRRINQAIKYRGQHLNIPSYKLNIFQFYCLDVALFFLVLILCCAKVSLTLFKRSYRYWRILPVIKEKGE